MPHKRAQKPLNFPNLHRQRLSTKIQNPLSRMPRPNKNPPPKLSIPSNIPRLPNPKALPLQPPKRLFLQSHRLPHPIPKRNLRQNRHNLRQSPPRNRRQIIRIKEKPKNQNDGKSHQLSKSLRKSPRIKQKPSRPINPRRTTKKFPKPPNFHRRTQQNPRKSRKIQPFKPRKRNLISRNLRENRLRRAHFLRQFKT